MIFLLLILSLTQSGKSNQEKKNVNISKDNGNPENNTLVVENPKENNTEGDKEEYIQRILDEMRLPDMITPIRDLEEKIEE